MNPTETNLTELRDAIASKQVSATEATQAYLARIDQYDPQIQAYNEVLRDYALERAAQVDSGTVSGPLAGVPIAVKDNICTTVGKTTCASKMLADFHAPYASTVAQKLEDAGAVIIGKANMDEFAMGSSTEHSSTHPTRNPWDTDRVPGGSSGGSAAVVAADLATAAIGSDTGGSIRQPASFCGVMGMKPTYGLVSRFGLVAFASSLDQIGPFGHTVRDVATLLQVIAGHDPKDSTSADDKTSGGIPDFLENLDKPVDSLRIGIAKQYMSDNNDPAVADATNNAIKQYEQLGATIVEVDLPHTEYGIPTYYIVATAEASSNLARYDGVHYGHRTESPEDLVDLYAASREEGFGEEVKRRIMLGTYALSSGYYDAYYLKALKVRRLIKQDFDSAFTQCDAILCPTATGPAFKTGEKSNDPLEMYLGDIYTVNCNLAGVPGISVPAGFTEVDGKTLPVGLQLIGAHFSEAKLLRIARMLEQAAGSEAKRPTLG